ncbi:778_t:CDS:2 [Paraglomus brasilianum]|uniref:778_t:CDS:1 n=1 Tax=Paraglomus brasilianum TaxID=144538 RepID=A0A9N8WPU9_9GLOM|nr:778_t:CDS:2 [Paraglomus brasilianum]
MANNPFPNGPLPVGNSTTDLRDFLENMIVKLNENERTYSIEFSQNVIQVAIPQNSSNFSDALKNSNSFILFRTLLMKTLNGASFDRCFNKLTYCSDIAGKAWGKAPPKLKKIFKDLSDESKPFRQSQASRKTKTPANSIPTNRTRKTTTPVGVGEGLEYSHQRNENKAANWISIKCTCKMITQLGFGEGFEVGNGFLYSCGKCNQPIQLQAVIAPFSHEAAPGQFDDVIHYEDQVEESSWSSSV